MYKRQGIARAGCVSGLVHSAHYVVGGSLAGCSNEWITRILPASTLAPFLFNCTRYTISLIVFGAKDKELLQFCKPK